MLEAETSEDFVTEISQSNNGTYLKAPTVEKKLTLDVTVNRNFRISLHKIFSVCRKFLLNVSYSF